MHKAQVKPISEVLPILSMTASVACLVLLDGFTKLLTSSVPPENIVFLRYTVAFILFFPLVIGKVKSRWPPRSIRYHFLRSTFGALSSWFYVMAVNRLELTTFVLITQTIPVFSAIVGAIFLKERIYSRKLFLLHFAIIACITSAVGTPKTFSDPLSVSYAVIGSFLYAISMAFGKKGSEIDGYSFATLCTLGFGALVTFPFTSEVGTVFSQSFSLTLVLSLGMLTLMSRLLSSWSLSHAPLSSLGALEYTTLFWAILFGFCLFDDVTSLKTVLFGTAGAFLGVCASRQKS